MLFGILVHETIEDIHRAALRNESTSHLCLSCRATHGTKVSNMNLYYTGEAEEPIIQFPYKKTAIDETIAVFDDTVHNIMSHNYKNLSKDNRTCNNCDFKHYCKNRQK